MRRRTFLGAGAVAIGGQPGVVTAQVNATGATAGSFEPLGRLAVDGLSEVVVDATGTIAYGALRDGFVVVDLADPADPTELARVTGILSDVENGPVTDIFDVKVDDDRLLVSGPHNSLGPDDASGFEVYDVSEPAAPRRTAAARTDHKIHNAFIDGETVYLAGSGLIDEPLIVYDISDDAPTEVARWSVADVDDAWGAVSPHLRQCHDVYVQDDVAYLAYWDAGTWLLDVSRPAEPAVITGFGMVPPASLETGDGSEFLAGMRELPGNSHYVQPSPDGAVIAAGKEAYDEPSTEVDGGPGGIALWARSGSGDPSRRTVLASPGAGQTSHNFGWRGDRLYTSWHGGGVAVFDVADPAAPRLLGRWADEGTTSFWTAQPARDSVVASSHLDPKQPHEPRIAGVGATLFTFPEPTDADGRPAETTSPVQATSASPTPVGDTPSASDRPDPSPSESQPGFGLLGTVAAGGLAAWRLAARRGETDE